MSESERDTPPTDGDIATHTPPDGEPAVQDDYAHHAFGSGGEPPTLPPAPETLLDEEPRPVRVRIRKLRVLGVLVGLGILAVVSTVFGMMMAITYDLPRLEEQSGRNSVLTDRNGKPLGLLTGNQKRIFLKSEEIAPVMKQAIIAIEDRRFYTNAGIDIRGIGRALWQDIRAQDAVQGGSTITMQFVKNALAAQDERTLFNKLREAALAYQITRKWSKERILRNYLNTIYFGNGAYGIESAARTYFGSNHPGCGEDGKPKCAQVLAPEEAALIAGMVASPSGYDPLRNKAVRRAAPRAGAAADGRAGLHHRAAAAGGALALAADPPRHPAAARGHGVPVLHVVGQAAGRRQARRRPGGRAQGVRGRADRADDARLAAPGRRPAGGQRVAAVAGRARAPRSSRSTTAPARCSRWSAATTTRRAPFNLATQGQRQPGSAFKPFVLAAGADRRHLARLHLGVAQDVALRHPQQEGQVHRGVRGQQLRGRLRRRPHAAHGDDVLRQRRLRAGRHQGRHAQDRAARAPDGHPHAGLAQLRDDARRPRAGRHAARHGARVPDARPARAASSTSTMSPGAVDRRKLAQARPRPGRHPR